MTPNRSPEASEDEMEFEIKFSQIHLKKGLPYAQEPPFTSNKPRIIWLPIEEEKPKQILQVELYIPLPLELPCL